MALGLEYPNTDSFEVWASMLYDIQFNLVRRKTRSNQSQVSEMVWNVGGCETITGLKSDFDFVPITQIISTRKKQRTLMKLEDKIMQSSGIGVVEHSINIDFSNDCKMRDKI